MLQYVTPETLTNGRDSRDAYTTEVRNRGTQRFP